MSRFWPHTPYAEDQPFAKPILYTHVLTRGIQTGALIGSGVGLTTHLVRTFRKTPLSGPLSVQILRSSGVGAAITTALMLVATPARMWGREEIEWEDRSWRLLENRGQVECDDWTYVGMLAGLVSAGRGGGWKGVTGRVGVGSVAGMAGYMGWRYGIKGGWKEEAVV